MRHNYFGKKLSRTKNERRRLLQILARELVIHGRITTTRAKAKALQPLIERMVTHAKSEKRSGMLEVRKIFADRIAANKLLSTAKDRFGERPGGYTRIIRLMPRLSDATDMAMIEFVDYTIEKPALTEDKSKKVVKTPKETAEKDDKKSKIKTERTKKPTTRKSTTK